MVERARAKTVEFAEPVTFKSGDVWDPPGDPASLEVILARHILWTRPDPQAALAGWRSLLRPGGLAREDIERVLGRALAVSAIADDAPLAPGMLASHYAPKTRLRLNAQTPRDGEAMLAFGKTIDFSGPTLNLSPRGDLIEAAANLFSHLRALDAAGAQTIAVMSVPQDGLGEAINDRLARAAAPR